MIKDHARTVYVKYLNSCGQTSSMLTAVRVKLKPDQIGTLSQYPVQGLGFRL